MGSPQKGNFYFLKTILFFCFCSLHAAGQDTTIRTSSFSLKTFVAPALLTGAGLSLSGAPKYEVRNWRNEHFTNFHTRADDVLCFAPIVVVYGLDLAGVKARTDFLNRSAILVKAELMAVGSVYLLKSMIREPRPDGSNSLSFPSNHSAQAFLAAGFLSMEYGGRIRWVPYVAYVAASSVAALRVLNNKHYINDVLVGAGIGLLSQKLAYLTHQYKWGEKKKQKVPLNF